VRLKRETIQYSSLGDTITGTLFLPESDMLSGALVICHGALDFRDNYFELCEFLAEKGITALAIDMHGHGESQGKRFHVDIASWVADISSGIDFLQGHERIDPEKIGVFGLSSGGTAALECAVKDPRIRAVITLDATVRPTVNLPEKIIMHILSLLGRAKLFLTGRELRLSMIKEFSKIEVASDLEVNRNWGKNPRVLEMWSSWPMPGSEESVIVDTIDRVHMVSAPTLVLHGQEDRIDPPETATMLFEKLTCIKQLSIIPGNGHMGHMDRNKARVLDLTARWALTHLDSRHHQAAGKDQPSSSEQKQGTMPGENVVN